MKQHYIQCDYCKKTFTAIQKSRKYCSQECFYQSNTLRREIHCQYCNKLFMQNNTKQKFCSNECQRSSRFIIDKPCKNCGKLRPRSDTVFCSKECYRQYSKEHCSGPNHHSYAGNKILDRDGYVKVYIGCGKKRAYEHRVIAESILGRKLKRNEVVHHINGVKTDNRNCNLLICSASFHDWLRNRMALTYQREHFS